MEQYVIYSESVYVMPYGLHTKQTLSAWWEHLCRQTEAYFHSAELYIKCSASDVCHNKENKKSQQKTMLKSLCNTLSTYLEYAEDKEL